MTEATGESGYVSCWTGTDVMIMAVAEGSTVRIGIAMSASCHLLMGVGGGEVNS